MKISDDTQSVLMTDLYYYESSIPKYLNHLDGLNQLFLDGHVKWFSRNGLIPHLMTGGGIRKDHYWHEN
jgi:prepilin-type processing-associated H-X9-DG protein